MRKKIGRKVYDTDKSEYVGRNAEGSYGDPTGFEESMYKKAKGDFFLLVSGGPESQYPEEDILPLALEDAVEWIGRIHGEDAVQEFVHDAKEAKLEKKSASKKSKKETK